MPSLFVAAHNDDLEGMHPAAVLAESDAWALVVTDSGAGTVKGFAPGRSLCPAPTTGV